MSRRNINQAINRVEVSGIGFRVTIGRERGYREIDNFSFVVDIAPGAKTISEVDLSPWGIEKIILENNMGIRFLGNEAFLSALDAGQFSVVRARNTSQKPEKESILKSTNDLGFFSRPHILFRRADNDKFLGIYGPDKKTLKFEFV